MSKNKPNGRNIDTGMDEHSARETKDNKKDQHAKNIDNNNKNETLNTYQAEEVIIQPHVTEKTFNMIERENKLTFIVPEKATKKKIAESLEVLYEAEVSQVNTLRTIRGKKAIVRFAAPEGARDLATKLGLV
jgi:large subunit ribosomal protein L23